MRPHADTDYGFVPKNAASLPSASQYAAAIVMALALVAPVHAQPPQLTGAAAASWEVELETSKLDGNVSYGASVPSEEVLANILDQPKHASLMLGCDKGKTSVMLSWPDLIDYDPEQQIVYARWKIDQGKIQSTRMFATTTTALAEGSDASRWIAVMTTGGKMVVSLRDKHGGQEATFDLAGASDVAAKIHSLGCS